MLDTGDSSRELALIHDVALLDDRELLDGVSGMILTSLRHERLTANLTVALNALEESRRRIAEAADIERARIERDLHDGAEQRLLALRIRLGLAEELLKTDPAAAVREVHRLGFEAERALEELRSIADGVYPPLLTGRGLHDALRAVAAQAPMLVHVIAVGITRHPVEVEGAVYFTCVEALQNALTYASGAGGVWIRLSQTRDRLSFEVSDDGPGFTVEGHEGRGLRRMHDRIEALGGELTVDARPGHGTRVIGCVRVAPTG
jgi:signal transduction histidine kinase